jgi:5-methylcytosine-specific restriction endonuclease McrA
VKPVSWRAEYTEYLFSPEWKAKRAQVMQRAGYLCERCDRPAQQVHHLTYERVYRERLTDLQAVCASCHRRLHRLSA